MKLDVTSEQGIYGRTLRNYNIQTTGDNLDFLAKIEKISYGIYLSLLCIAS